MATLGGLLLGLATALAGSFDARNGTGHQSGRIAAWLAERPARRTGPAARRRRATADDDGPTTRPDDGPTLAGTSPRR